MAKFYTTKKQDVTKAKVLSKRKCFQLADKILISSSPSGSHCYESGESKVKRKHGKREVKATSPLNTIKIDYTEFLCFTLSKTHK